MTALAQIWRAWVALWDRREPATAQALVRIAVGLCLLCDLLYVQRLGLIEMVWAPPPFGVGYGASDHVAVVRWFGASVATARLAWWAAAVSIALFTAGAATRIAAIAFVFASAQLSYLAPDSDRGIDVALRVVVLVLAASWGHARWSVDAWLRRRIGKPFPKLVPAWPRLLLFLQLVWIYFSGGTNKSGIEWGPRGEWSALANALSDPGFGRFTADWVPHVFALTQVGTIVTMGFELGAPAMILLTWLSATRDRGGHLRTWINRTRLRWAWIAIGVAFHAGIAVTLRLGIFPYGMLALYPVLFHPDELERAEAWLRRRLARMTRPIRSETRG